MLQYLVPNKAGDTKEIHSIVKQLQVPGIYANIAPGSSDITDM